MRVQLQVAAPYNVPDLVSLRAIVNQCLLSEYGDGFWVVRSTEKAARFGMRRGTVYLARHRGELIATLTLSSRKPWAIDKKYFHPSKKHLYLTAMAVHPDYQRKGIGSRCLEQASTIARQWPSDAIRLDAYDVAAGAGDFYRKCGFREVGRAVYRVAPLIYFEMLL